MEETKIETDKLELRRYIGIYLWMGFLLTVILLKFIQTRYYIDLLEANK